jgi:hypothetical protein
MKNTEYMHRNVFLDKFYTQQFPTEISNNLHTNVVYGDRREQLKGEQGISEIIRLIIKILIVPLQDLDKQ